jgi:hypothetical protein
MRIKCDQVWVLKTEGKSEESHRCSRLRGHFGVHKCRCGKELDREFDQYKNEHDVVVLTFEK